jgi:hypothetical protein
MRARRPLNMTSDLQPDGWPSLVNGAAMTRGKARFMSSGETTSAGRVFFISKPMVGSSLTQ